MNIYCGFRLGTQLAGFLLSNIAKTWICLIIDHRPFLRYSVFYLQNPTLPETWIHLIIDYFNGSLSCLTSELVRSMNYDALIQVFMLNIISTVRCSWPTLPDLSFPLSSIFTLKVLYLFSNLIFFSSFSFLPTLSFS